MKHLYLTLTFLLVWHFVYSQDTDAGVNPGFSRFRFSLAGGAGYMTASTKEAERNLVNMGFSKPDVNNYYNQIKIAFPAGASVHYFINPSLALGVNYNYFSTGSRIKGLVDLEDGVYFAYWKMKEQLYINFAGPSLLFQERYGLNKKMGMSAAYALGYISYRNEVTLFNFPALITGNTIGMTGDIGLEYRFWPGIALGADISYLTGILKKFAVNNGQTIVTQKLEEEDYENISRISLSAGLKIYF